MVLIMDMSTGQVEARLEPEFGRHEDEVLNAGWLRPELQLGLQPVVPYRDRSARKAGIESFLNAYYLNQE